MSCTFIVVLMMIYSVSVHLCGLDPAHTQNLSPLPKYLRLRNDKLPDAHHQDKVPPGRQHRLNVCKSAEQAQHIGIQRTIADDAIAATTG